MAWIISPIDTIGRSASSLRKERFDSGNVELDQYLKQYALKNDRDGLSKAFVAFLSDGSQAIAGYYSCCAGALIREELPAELQEKLPRYPIPIMLIGKLAVARSVQGRGLGKRLLFHALENAVNVSSQKMGIYAVGVDAIDEKAKGFYVNAGFREMLDKPLSLLLRIETIKQAREHLSFAVRSYLLGKGEAFRLISYRFYADIYCRNASPLQN